ncbi:hypothetical protein P0D91_18705 [Pseudomonas sp. CBSPBW29]|uniref:hypothetical protein n=1 Tax=Pseudomonas TaxID=286 RepID=UPI0021AD183F|nr:MULTISPECIES: hypothetical protein [unclassified Pseudomonas]WEL40337.1 hypothetical protein P0D91_18705 [Pseudomonas sp. CBSPBW29]WEL67082.1 hypothetical protein P0D93_12860 [Pseudomonas sp. CBSPGW29]WEL70584.1 hypothetical protein P0D94_32155 [Pseudomonas sp. CBSPCGW29]WEL77506.1 hypothetical protein P0D92_04800 [Pseudomonas sp. CBSPAW29]WEL83866.1 hypothetical protein P0D95_07585 [Pseudomonas sp. CBSPCAW29]WEL86711.1 hypothetical protein P0D90_23285 [Pseudomonas sp. CBSPCBW29]
MFEGIEWTTVYVSLASGLAGASGPVVLWYMQARKERASVRASLLAEVSALLEMVERRHYLRELRLFEKQLADLPQARLDSLDEKEVSFALPNGENYNRVYQANLSRLGALSSTEAAQIVRFYQLADSVRADLSNGGILAKGSTNHADWGETAEILEVAIGIGEELTKPSRSLWQRLKSRRKI